MKNKLEIDPAILKIKKIVEKRNYDGWIMLNLYAQVTPEPNELHKNEDFDIYLHKKNINIIKEILKNYPNANILACWGNLTKKGNPRHPLYGSIDANLEIFNIENYIENL